MAAPSVDSAASVDDVVALFEEWGPHRYDEEVSQLDHALQTAAHARSEGAHDALVVAALVHDTGHLLELRVRTRHLDALAPEGRQRTPDLQADLVHEAVGARWLAALFPSSVTGPIAMHVAAKRYRCAVDPGYQHGLSAGSVRSLVRQGGPMSADERARFERHPAHVDAVHLRAWDDAGKVTEGIDVPGLAAYVPLLHRLARP